MSCNEKTSVRTSFRGAFSARATSPLLGKRCCGEKPYYWTSDGRAEIEFVIDKDGEIIPVEVKAEGNIGGRSLSVYTQKFNPEKRVRLSMNNLQENGGLYSIPNPMADWTIKMLSATADE